MSLRSYHERVPLKEDIIERRERYKRIGKFALKTAAIVGLAIWANGAEVSDLVNNIIGDDFDIVTDVTNIDPTIVKDLLIGPSDGVMS